MDLEAGGRGDGVGEAVVMVAGTRLSAVGWERRNVRASAVLMDLAHSTGRDYSLGWRLIPFQIHNHPWSSFQAAAALTIAQSRLMMDVIRAGCSEKYVHACSTALRASSTVGNSLFARKFDFR